MDARFSAHRVRRTALWLAAPVAIAVLVAAPAGTGSGAPPGAGGAFAAVVLPSVVRDSMDAIWRRMNLHWNELAEENTLTQMLGTGKSTQLEFLGCFHGHVVRDTLYVTGWEPARNMKQFQFAVTGDCSVVDSLVGTWHTHPFRADSVGHPLKEAGLSRQDLQTFAKSGDKVVMVVWDVDSLDGADRGSGQGVRHPAHIIQR